MTPIIKLALTTFACSFAGIFILFCFWMGGLWAMLGLSLVGNAILGWIVYENKGATTS